jgi:preprotein translocase subunit SecF
MLNKDQYNQDEYNNYYKQEVEGAEIKGYDDNEGGFLKKAVLFFGLLALGVAGFFGFKLFTNTEGTEVKEKIVIKEEPVELTKTNNSKTIEDKVIETIEHNKATINKVAVETQKTAKELEERTKAVEEKIEKTIQEQVATQVKEKLETNKKMSTEDISKIVNIVMSKMQTENKQSNKDHDLLSALENNEHDTLEGKPKTNETLNKNIISTIKEANAPIHTNNKVTLDHDSKENNNDLDKLSEQIKKLLNMEGADETATSHSTTVEVPSKTKANNTTNYEDSISKEIEVRTNEMRIIIVQPGDTLNKIALRAYGDGNSYQKIFDANPEISRADKIYVGQKLRIPE